MNIIIRVETGNDALQTGAEACAAIASKFEAIADRVNRGEEGHGAIMDDNGNSVGTYEVWE